MRSLVSQLAMHRQPHRQRRDLQLGQQAQDVAVGADQVVGREANAQAGAHGRLGGDQVVAAEREVLALERIAKGREA